MISRETVSKIMDAARIEDVVSDYVTLKKRGAAYVACCPFHNEKTPSFYVTPSRGIFKCFGCGVGGDAITFIREYEKLSYVEALRLLAKKYNIEIEERELTPEEKQSSDARESMMLVNAYAQDYFSKILHTHTDGKTIGMTYFAERGFTAKTIEKFQLGYCLERSSSFTETALRDGYKKEFLVQTGLTVERENGTTYDRFFGRVMFPIHNLSGRVIAFAGRTLRTDKTVAKYVNSPESPIYTKGKTLYGIYFAKKAISKLDRCYLVEGQTDVISMHQAGIENVVASGGTALTYDQILLIRRFTPNITVLYDGDAAGIHASLRGIDMLLQEGMNVKTVLLPDGEDPDSYARSHSATEFSEFIAAHEENFISFKAKILLADANNDPIRKADAVADIVRSIAAIPDAVKRSLFVREAASMLDVDEALVVQEVRNAVRNLRDKLDKEAGVAARMRGESAPVQRESISAEAPSAAAAAASPSASAAEASPRTPAIPAFVKDVFCQVQERELIFFLLKYGSEPFYDTRVDRYLISELVNEELNFQNLEYRRIFEEYQRLLSESDTVDCAAFVHHPDNAISKQATDVLAERYTLSRIWSKGEPDDNPDNSYLLRGLPKAIAAYKMKVITMEIQRMRTELASATEDLSAMLNRLRRLNQIRILLAKELDRPV